MSTDGERVPRARSDDHATSRAGARSVAARAPNQRLRLLVQYVAAGEDGCTDEEAAEAAELRVGSTCWWRRCTDLREDRCIEQQVRDGEPVTRVGDAGVERIVCTITPVGLAVLRAHELLPESTS